MVSLKKDQMMKIEKTTTYRPNRSVVNGLKFLYSVLREYLLFN